jgi:hypothetical protein
MRFITPSQTISEYRHHLMPIYETLATIGTAAAIGVVGAGASYGLSQLNKPKAPSYNSGSSLQNEQSQFYTMFPQVQQYEQNAYNDAQTNALNLAYNFSQGGTQANIGNQNLVTPGSSAQRELALKQINSYIKGQIPLDVQQNIQRQVAQGLGGGFNVFSGGGQAPQNFARNIGQTSVGLSQFGLSAAPTWQQLANSMVVSPAVGLQAGMQGTLQAYGQGNQLASVASGQGLQQAENQYQSQMNQYGAQMAQSQQLQQALGTGINAGLGAYGGMTNANYLQGLSGYGGSSAIPAAQYAGSMVPLSSAPQSVKDKYGW